MLLQTACADFHRGSAPDGSAPLVDDTVFENDVYPILQTNCAFCHSLAGPAGSSQYVLTGNAKADRAMVVKLVSPGNPDDSLLLQRASGNSHEGGQVLPADGPEYATVRAWIASLPPAP